MYISSPEDIFFIAFYREEGREGERGRNINAREKYQLVAFSYVPLSGIEPATWVCAEQESNVRPFGLWDDAPTN